MGGNSAKGYLWPILACRFLEPKMHFTAREILVAIPLVAVFVGAFINCRIVTRALLATEELAVATSAALK
jgi:hypothetical protein